MDWHSSRATGAAFRPERARSLDFGPRQDVRTFDGLALFPHVTNELRDARAGDLIPRGHGDRPGIVGLYGSGGPPALPGRLNGVGHRVCRIFRKSRKRGMSPPDGNE